MEDQDSQFLSELAFFLINTSIFHNLHAFEYASLIVTTDVYLADSCATVNREAYF